MNYKDKTSLYLRKSRMDDMSESIDETLERHRRILTEYAIKHNITITAVYKEVVSGDSLFCRPEMIRLLNDIEQDKYTAVLCVDIDRLGRSSSKDSGIIMETLQEHNCKIITPDKVYDLDDDVDEMTVEMKTFFARQELKSIKKRLHRGEVETLKQGGHTGEPPYGYKRIWIGKIPSLAPTEEADTVRMIYDWYVDDGYGGTIISDKLNAMGSKASDGGKWSRTSVRMVLTNPIYTGKIVWNRKRRIKKKTPTDKFRETDNPPEQWLIANGLHEAIIDQDKWDKAQTIRVSRSHPPAHTGVLKNPFAGLVYCRNCGTAIVRQNSIKKRHESLLCPSTGCVGSVVIRSFEERLLALIKDKYNSLLLKETQNDTNSKKANLIRQAASAKTAMRQLRTQKEKLHDFLEQGIYDTDTFMERQQALQTRITAAEKEYNEAKIKLNAINETSFESIIPKMEHLLNNWQDFDVVEKNTLLKELILKITYFRPCALYTKPDFEIEIEWRF